MGKSIMSELIAKGRVRYGYLGIRLNELDRTLAQGMGLNVTKGILVEDVQPDTPASKAGMKRRDVIVRYRGVPAAGLLIAPNKHGDRSFFSGNWPDKARQGSPSSTTPRTRPRASSSSLRPHYQVVSNGLLVEETDLGDGRRLTHWRQSVPIASWLYVLGAARFAVEAPADVARGADRDVRPADSKAVALTAEAPNLIRDGVPVPNNK